MNNIPADKNRRVLVIDDNHAIHDDFRKILSPTTTAAAAALDATETAVFGPLADAVQQTQFEVDSAYQGQEGVMLVEKALKEGRPYAMAFVDIRMPPGWDGVETTRKIWELDPNLQIVLCTAYSDYSWGEMFDKLGRRDGLLILKKPFDGVEAFQLAHALTEKWWLHQQSQRKMEELESQVAGRTHELQDINHALQMEVVEHQRAEETLRESEEKFRQLASNITDVFWITSPDLQKIHYVSPAYEQIWGRSAQNSYTNPHEWAEAILPEERERVFATFLRLAQERSVSTEFRIARPDGTVRWIFSRGFQVRDVAGNVIRLAGVASDITDRKQNEEALRESEEKFRQLASNITDVFWMTSPDLKVIHYISPGYELIWGRSAESLYANPHQWVECILPEERERVFGIFGTLMQDEPSVSVEYRIARPDGTIRWVHDRGFQVRDAAGKLVRLTGIVTDITERKQFEQALERSQKRLRDLIDGLGPSMFVGLMTPDGILIECNRSSLAAAGLKPEDVLGKPFEETFWWAYSKEVQQQLRETIARAVRGEGSRYDVQVRAAEGQLIDVDFSLYPLRDETGEVVYLVPSASVITERKRAEESLRLLGTAVEQSKESIVITDADLDLPGPRIIFVNPAFTKMTGFTAEEAVGKTPRILQGPHTDKAVLRRLRQNLQRGEAFEGEAINYRKDGKEFNLEWQIAPLRDASGNTTHFVAIQHDITERKQLETQLFQSQKMETVGKLAGGIAHEFNSILTAIIGRSELLLNDLPSGSPDFANAIAIRNAADLAAALTKQLLAYGRKQILRSESLNLNHVLAGMEAMLRHLMGSDVDVRVVTAVDLPAVKADAGQVEQVIMNIAINAREAMHHGGKLTLETSTATLNEEYVRHFPEVKPGDYVMIAISDTGTGMSGEVKARLFEPFFTTKSVGEGTGLGLATCHGIIKQSGGHISVYSELGRGTTFKVYLPQTGQRTEVSTATPASPALPRGTETILLVEDDTSLREMASLLLQRLGYAVLVAANGPEALSLTQQPDTERIDLLFTDIVMPQMDGKELSNRIMAIHPNTKVLFTSAYTETAIVHQGVLDPGVSLLQKPFTPAALALKVRELLDA